MTAPGNSALLLVLLALFVAGTAYAAGRLHQWYQTGLDRDEAYRDGYDTATRSVFSLAARIIGPRRDRAAIRASAGVPVPPGDPRTATDPRTADDPGRAAAGRRRRSQRNAPPSAAIDPFVTPAPPPSATPPSPDAPLPARLADGLLPPPPAAPAALPQPSSTPAALPQPSSVPSALPQPSSVPSALPQPSSVPAALTPLTAGQLALPSPAGVHPGPANRIAPAQRPGRPDPAHAPDAAGAPDLADRTTDVITARDAVAARTAATGTPAAAPEPELVEAGEATSAWRVTPAHLPEGWVQVEPLTTDGRTTRDEPMVLERIVADEPSRGRHQVPDELVQADTYRLTPDRVARAKVRDAPTDGEATTRLPSPRPRSS